MPRIIPTRRGFNIVQKGLLLVAVPVIFELLFAVPLMIMLRQQEAMTDRIDASREALVEMHTSQQSLARVFLIIKQFLDTGPSTAIPDFQGGLSFLASERDSLKVRAANAPHLQRLLAGSEDLIADEVQTLKRARAVYFDHSVAPESRIGVIRDDCFKLLVDLSKLQNQISSQEQAIELLKPPAERKFAIVLGWTILFGVSGNIILALLLSMVFSKDFVQRLKRISGKVESLLQGQSLGVLPDGADEIHKLETVVHDAKILLEETRRKELLVSDNAACVIFSLDSNLTITAISASCQRLWQCTPQSLQGKSIKDMINSDSWRLLVSAVTMLRAEHIEQSADFEADLILPNGRTSAFLWHISSCQADHLLVCVLHDITEERNMRLSSTQQIAMICHDLRNPVTACANGIETMSSEFRTKLDLQTAKDLQVTGDSINDVVESIGVLLDLTKLQNGRLRLEIACVSAIDLCTSLVDRCTADAEAKGIELRGPFGDASISGDEERLRQAMLVFLRAVLQLLPAGRIIVIRSKEIADTVEIAFGIEAKHPDQFTDIGQKRMELCATGSQLALARAIISAHFGSTVISGDQFKIHLPRYGGYEEQTA